MKEKEKNIYGIHQYTLTRRRKIRGKKRKIKCKQASYLSYLRKDDFDFLLRARAASC